MIGFWPFNWSVVALELFDSLAVHRSHGRFCVCAPPEIDFLSKSKFKTDRERCIPLLEEHLQKNQGDTKSWYDLGCCFDFLGRELEAEPHYEKVFELGTEGLSIDDQVGFYVGYGSTLRNNKKFDESKKVLREGVSKFPDSVALKVFLGFTLYSSDEYKEAARVLLSMAGQLPAEVMDGFERAARWYSEKLDKSL